MIWLDGNLAFTFDVPMTQVAGGCLEKSVSAEWYIRFPQRLYTRRLIPFPGPQAPPGQ